MRAFVTGASGFVGHWLCRHLQAVGDEVVVLAPGTDVSEPGAVAEELAGAGAQVLYHLAGLTHVGRSWEEPAATVRVNALGTLEVLEAARRCQRPPRVLVVSSSEVYGHGDGSPLDESAPLRPFTPYAASKVAAEFLALQAHLGRGLEVVVARPFNHVGPGQSPAFVVAGLAERIAVAERDGAATVPVGNLSAQRDFTDVRDVVRAYRMLAAAGEPGAVYNICSGRAVAIETVAKLLLQAAGSRVELEVDPALLRPVDVPLLVGDPARLQALTGWEPAIPLEQTLIDVLAEARVRAGVSS